MMSIINKKKHLTYEHLNMKWREFRNKLSNFNEFEQLQLTADFWAKVPLQTYVIDWDKSKKWLTAWELIHEGNFDTNVIGLLMEQTLILTGWEPDRLKLMYVKDTKIEDQMMILLVDDKWVLNYSYKEVFDYDRIKPNFVVFIRYQIKNNERIEL